MTTKPWFVVVLAGLLLPLAIVACSSEVTTANASGAGGAASSSSSADSSTSSASATSTSSSSSSSNSSSNGSMNMGPCGDPGCSAGQLCVVPQCREVLGEECYFAAADAGEICPPGTKRAPQFDADCFVSPNGTSYACVTGCPPAAPFCLDVPSACAGMPTCACIGENPCEPSNSGYCKDSNIADGVLTCSLQP